MLHAAGVASAAGVSRCHCLCRTPASRKASWHRVISCAGAAGLGGAMLRAADAMLRAAGAAGLGGRGTTTSQGGMEIMAAATSPTSTGTAITTCTATNTTWNDHITPSALPLPNYPTFHQQHSAPQHTPTQNRDRRISRGGTDVVNIPSHTCTPGNVCKKSQWRLSRDRFLPWSGNR